MEKNKAVEYRLILIMMTMHWLMNKGSGITFQKVKENAHRRNEWRHWNLRPAQRQNINEEKSKLGPSNYYF